MSLPLPPCDVAVLGGAAQLAGAIVMNGPVRVEVEMLFQSTWNLYTDTALVNCQTTLK